MIAAALCVARQRIANALVGLDDVGADAVRDFYFGLLASLGCLLGLLGDRFFCVGHCRIADFVQFIHTRWYVGGRLLRQCGGCVDNTKASERE